MKFTLPFDSPRSDLSSTGGKGNNLAILTRDGNFPVPPGFTVTVDAYHAFVSDNGLLQVIENTLADKSDDETTSTASLEKKSERIRGAFRRCDLSSEIEAEIGSQLSKTIPDPGVNLAVRSSATCEDMPDASFAGQHDTYLNVSRTAVCRHVVDCFGSLFTSRAISYRDRNGLSHTDAAMAVVVQALVPSDSSGVLFTANPLTGRRTESVLEVIPGLGEALVSGLTEPDRYVVSRRNHNKNNKNAKIKIKDARVGAKLTTIRPVDGGGVKEEKKEKPTEEEGSSSAATVLTEEEVCDLVRLGQRVEALFENHPQDIEFARSKGKTYLVQSRPITTLFPLPPPPATTPADGGDDALRVFFSFGAIQGVGSPFFPAGAEAIESILGGIVRWISWGHGGKEKIFETVAERLYIEFSPILRNSIGRKIFLKMFPFLEPGIRAGVSEILKEEEDNNNGRLDIHTGVSPVMLLRLLSVAAVAIPRVIYTLLFPDRSRKSVEDRLDKAVASVSKEAEGVTNLLDLVRFKERTLSGFFPKHMLHFVPRFVASIGPLAFLTDLASSKPGGKDLALTITRGMPHNCTTEMDLVLWDTARTIRGDAESLEYLRGKDANALAEDYIAGDRLPRVARDAVRGFLATYGMRGLNEIDFGRPRWREEPAPLMQTLKSYVEIDEEYAPDRVFAKGEKAAEAAVKRLGEELGMPWLVSFLAHRVRTVAGIRELPKFTMIRVMGVIRAKMLEEGEKLAKAGKLDAATDVFLFNDDELENLALGGGEEEADDFWKTLAAERKASMAVESERTRIPKVIASDGFAFFGGGVDAAAAGANKNALVGEPVSPGVYEGTVHIVHDPSESALKPGEILCCHGTDPSWTPLFLAAGALVMECGGLMTHGSVVAREYGIPAVVGLEKVTERLRTGQRIRVDGSSGVVLVLDEEDEDG